ncbi:VOC family protein [Rhodonellum sp.]|uniref:VOC family protein n=1 Tax=Rhodonellum sp. TaxID=2231180 RepID=UPI00271BE592|nr:VOC family protein [Rhodonellum sp.]MDO9554111.1 VOC family protein [Rhodonellum sp.]
MTTQKRITPCLWFDTEAEEAAKFYTGLFAKSEIGTISRFGKEGFEFHRKPEGSVMSVNFKLKGQDFMALNGGTEYKFSPSISFFVVCESIAEVDLVWDTLLAGGSSMMALDKYEWSEKYGWLNDKYGISWQISYGKIDEVGQKFTTTFMFVGDQFGRAEEAIHFYTSIFKNSKIQGILKYNEADGDVPGKVKHAQFKLLGQTFMAMESSLVHAFNFTPAISQMVYCDTQEEIDHYWDSFTSEGEEVQCGWLVDKFGVS